MHALPLFVHIAIATTQNKYKHTLRKLIIMGIIITN